MSSFEYEALDADGRQRIGIIAADTARLARQELRLMNLIPLSVKLNRQRKQRLSGLVLPSLGTKIGGRDLTLFTRQLATLLDAGAPLEGALQTLVQQTQVPSHKRILSELRADVAEGHTFAEALARHDKSFSQLYRALVSSGEASGSLPTVLDRLATHLEKSQRIRNKVITACVYPAVLAVTALGVVLALVAFVVPKVVEQFDSLGQTLPGLTRAVISLSTLLTSHGFALVAGLAILLVVSARIMALPPVRIVLDRGILRMPLLGRLSKELQAARLARTLSTLISCGTPVVDGLKASINTVGNGVLRNALDHVTKQVQEGASLSSSLKVGNLFPPLLIYMVAVGEESGRLDTMLSKAADHLENEFEMVTQTALSLLEPAIIVVMGGVVATIVLAVLLPILRLNSLALM